MSYIANYKKWRAMHEAAIFEGKDPRRAPISFSLADGFDARNYGTSMSFSTVVKNLVSSNVPSFTGIINQLTDIIQDSGSNIIKVGGSSTGEPSGGSLGGQRIDGIKSSTVSYYLTAMLEGAMGQFTEKEAEKVVPANVSLADAGYQVKFTPDPSGWVATVGNLTGTKLKGVSEESSENYDILIGYVNYYNILAKAYGQPQYDGTDANFTNGYFDFKNATGAGGADDPLILFIPTVQKVGAIARSEEDIVKEIAGIPAEKQRADVGFEQGKSILTSAGKTQVATLAQTILERFAGKTIETFELISSASPEWNSKETMANYAGKTTSGTGDPGVGNDFASNNAKLAYDRGTSFMTELNSVLKAKGHPGFDKYTVKWQITDKGGPLENGRFVDLNLVTNESKPKIEKVGTKVTGTATAGAATGGEAEMSCNVYYFKVKRPVKE
jgi:hypothetical protein